MTRQPKTSAPDDLTRDEQKQIRAFVQIKAHPTNRRPDPFYVDLAKHPARIRYHVDMCLAHFQGTTVKRPGWVTTVKKWIIEEARRAEERRTGEKPQMQGKRSPGFSPLTDELAKLTTAEMFEGE